VNPPLYPPRACRGDRVAVVSPSSRAAAHFPAPVELGLLRLREEFGLEPVEYPTTRAQVASPEERAADLHAAFADPQIAAVIATIGGDDEIKVLRHIDPDVLQAHPKPFFGYSDNTNLLLYLWNLGIVGYHGGSVMVQFGRPGAMNSHTRASLEAALLGGGWTTLAEPAEYSTVEGEWSDPKWPPDVEPKMVSSEGWSWHGPERKVEGRTWGGCLEILDFHFRAGRYLQPNEAYEGCLLFCETSEEMPSSDYVYQVLMGMGERGLLQQFSAVVWGRPKSWSHENRTLFGEQLLYEESQHEAVEVALAEYHPEVPWVFGVDLGHTDPQLVIPYGGDIVVDTALRRIDVRY
jgi:muramoyltetrapeptide carboxypeptidase LdcA involved in peptidoglycan recycling